MFARFYDLMFTGSSDEDINELYTIIVNYNKIREFIETTQEICLYLPKRSSFILKAIHKLENKYRIIINDKILDIFAFPGRISKNAFHISNIPKSIRPFSYFNNDNIVQDLTKLKKFTINYTKRIRFDETDDKISDITEYYKIKNYLDYSAYFGYINNFMNILQSKAKNIEVTTNTIRLSILGYDNNTIINYLLDNYESLFDESCLICSLASHRYDVYIRFINRFPKFNKLEYLSFYHCYEILEKEINRKQFSFTIIRDIDIALQYANKKNENEREMSESEKIKIYHRILKDNDKETNPMTIKAYEELRKRKQETEEESDNIYKYGEYDRLYLFEDITLNKRIKKLTRQDILYIYLNKREYFEQIQRELVSVNTSFKHGLLYPFLVYIENKINE